MPILGVSGSCKRAVLINETLEKQDNDDLVFAEDGENAHLIKIYAKDLGKDLLLGRFGIAQDQETELGT